MKCRVKKVPSGCHHCCKEDDCIEAKQHLDGSWFIQYPCGCCGENMSNAEFQEHFEKEKPVTKGCYRCKVVPHNGKHCVKVGDKVSATRRPNGHWNVIYPDHCTSEMIGEYFRLHFWPVEDPTREELIERVRAAIPKMEDWKGIDDHSNVLNRGHQLALLIAGCRFEIVPSNIDDNRNVVKIHVNYPGISLDEKISYFIFKTGEQT